MKRIVIALLLAALALSLLTACASAPKAAETTAPAASIPDGTYSVKFNTDSSMFHANEACKGRGTLTVSSGVMTLHVSMPSKNILNLFPGKAADAEAEGAALLQPTLDLVTYSDGYQEEVYGFDIPVPEIDQEFDLALIGTKGKWYDHVVSVSDPQSAE